LGHCSIGFGFKQPAKYKNNSAILLKYPDIVNKEKFRESCGGGRRSRPIASHSNIEDKKIRIIERPIAI
jgi:hypothetical protein